MTAEEALRISEPIIRGLIGKYIRGNADDREDVGQECRVAVAKAAIAYQPSGSPGAYFSTVAHNEIVRWLRDRSRVIRLPRSAYARGEESPRVISYDALETSDGEAVDSDYNSALTDPSVDIESEVSSKLEFDWLHENLEYLTGDERRVLEWQLRGETTETIGKRLGVSKQWISQLSKDAVSRLRSWVTHPNLRPTARFYFPVTGRPIHGDGKAGYFLRPEKQELIWQLRMQGYSIRQIMGQVGAAKQTVMTYAREVPLGKSNEGRGWRSIPRRTPLAAETVSGILLLRAQGTSLGKTARQLGVSKAVVIKYERKADQRQLSLEAR